MPSPPELSIELNSGSDELDFIYQENQQLKAKVAALSKDLQAVEQAWMIERIKVDQQEKTFKLIQLLYQDILTAIETNTIYQVVVESLTDNLGFDQAIIFEKNPEGTYAIAHHGYPHNPLLQNHQHPLFDKLIEQKNGIVINGTSSSKVLEVYRIDNNIKYYIAIPCIVSSDKILLLFVGNQQEDILVKPRLTYEDLERLQILVNQIILAIDHANRYTQSQEIAIKSQKQTQELETTLNTLKNIQSQKSRKKLVFSPDESGG